MLGNIKSYDTSGRVNNFYLCNVGADGIEEFFSGIGDDICQQIFLESSKTYKSFPGLSESEAVSLVESEAQKKWLMKIKKRAVYKALL